MFCKLSDITKVQFGLYSKPIYEKGINYLQVKNFSNSGQLTEKITTFLSLEARKEEHMLTYGDMLFVGKGYRNFAWAYTPELGKSVASSSFFVVRTDTQKIYPEYLAILFNSDKYQTLFKTIGAGSSIISIRKSELEAIKIDVPDLKTQKRIIELQKLHQKDLTLSNQIVEEKEKRFQTIMNQLINN